MIKKLFRSILVIVMAIIGISVIFGAVMMFIPTTTIFGLRFVRVNAEYENYNYYIKDIFNNQPASINLVVDTPNLNIKIVPNDVENFIIDGNVNVIGYYKIDEQVEELQKNYDIKSADGVRSLNKNLFAISIYGEGNTVHISTNAPSGLLSYTSSDLTVYVPNKYCDNANALNTLSVNAKSSATIEKSSKTNKLIAVNSLVMKISGGNITPLAKVVNSAEFELKNGNVYLDGLIENGSTLNEGITFTSKYAKLNATKQLNATKLEVKGDYCSVILTDLIGNFSYTGEGAMIDAKSINGTVHLVSSAVIFNCEKIENGEFVVNSEEEYSNKASINVGDIDGVEIKIYNASGKINLGSIKSSNKTTIYTKSADINIESFTGATELKTTTGDINASQSDAEFTGNIDVITEKGSIELKNISNKLTYKATNSAKANITIKELIDGSSISCQKGESIIKVLETHNFKVATTNNEGTIKFNIASTVKDIKTKTNITEIKLDNAQTQPTLNIISNKGTITITNK